MDLLSIRQSIGENIHYTINSATRFKNTTFDIEWYRAYLAKNLFRFSRFSTVRFSDNKNTVYFLEPLGYRTCCTNEDRTGATQIFITDKKIL